MYSYSNILLVVYWIIARESHFIINLIYIVCVVSFNSFSGLLNITHARRCPLATQGSGFIHRFISCSSSATTAQDRLFDDFVHLSADEKERRGTEYHSPFPVKLLVNL